MSDMLTLRARRQQTASHRSSEELWQSTLVHVIRISLEVVSAKVKESKSFALLGVLRSYVVARVLLRWMLSVAAIVRAFHVVATCANPRLASLVRRPCRSNLEPPSPRSLFTHACILPRAAGQPALHVLFVIMLALTSASSLSPQLRC